MKSPMQIRNKILEIDKKRSQLENTLDMCSIDEAIKICKGISR